MTTISANVVKELRDQTGAGMMDCKRALAECNGDIETAKDWLRKKGQATAEKKSVRRASEGLICCLIDSSAKKAAILELNCETDFVARNEKFVGLVKSLTAQVLEGGAGTRGGKADDLLAASSKLDPARTVQEVLKEYIATLGENITLGRFERIETGGPGGFLISYLHPPGKLGVLLELKTGDAKTHANARFRQVAQNLAMHVAGAAPPPEVVTKDQVPKATIDRELEIYREVARNEGKPDNLVEKIVQGKLNKFLQSVALMDQEFVMEPDLTITKLLDQLGKEVGDTVGVVRFARVKVGG